MQDHICQVPSAACQIAKSTGCWRSVLYLPRSGLPATCHHGLSILGTSTTSAALAFCVRANPVSRQSADTMRTSADFAVMASPPLTGCSASLRPATAVDARLFQDFL